MKKFLINIIWAVLAIVILPACSSDEPSTEITLYDIVKLELQTDDGSVYTLQKPDSDEVITLIAPGQTLNTNLVAVGERLFLVYVPESGVAYKSGNVTLRGYMPITNAEIVDREVPEQWDVDPVYLMAAWRAGAYLNMRIKLPATQTPRTFALVRDPKSPNPAHPDLYLCHALKEPINTYDKVYYASFDISALTDDPNIDGFTLHLNDCNLNLKTIEYTFRK